MHRRQTDSLASQKTMWLIHGILANLRKALQVPVPIPVWKQDAECSLHSESIQNSANESHQRVTFMWNCWIWSNEEWKFDLGPELESRHIFLKNDSPVSQNLAARVFFLQITRFPIEAKDGRCLGEPSFVGLLWSLHSYWTNLTNNQRRAET